MFHALMPIRALLLVIPPPKKNEGHQAYIPDCAPLPADSLLTRGCSKAQHNAAKYSRLLTQYLQADCTCGLCIVFEFWNTTNHAQMPLSLGRVSNVRPELRMHAVRTSGITHQKERKFRMLWFSGLPNKKKKTNNNNNSSNNNNKP